VYVEALVCERPQFGGTSAGFGGFDAAELRLSCGFPAVETSPMHP
jgi:hypothetical protein